MKESNSTAARKIAGFGVVKYGNEITISMICC